MMNTRLKFIFHLLLIFAGSFSVSVVVEAVVSFFTGIKDSPSFVLVWSLTFGLSWVLVEILKGRRTK